MHSESHQIQSDSVSVEPEPDSVANRCHEAVAHFRHDISLLEMEVKKLDDQKAKMQIEMRGLDERKDEMKKELKNLDNKKEQLKKRVQEKQELRDKLQKLSEDYGMDIDVGTPELLESNPQPSGSRGNQAPAISPTGCHTIQALGTGSLAVQALGTGNIIQTTSADSSPLELLASVPVAGGDLASFISKHHEPPGKRKK
ncbi:uncharacterized protein LOC118439497 [Folsomia candida]|uniref:uncharacterized protein LOC118439497 n=1 Tax=Folsomia candida TaxID=158441 RepID=UPI0016052AA8|nr:uncharacterized protein LOC118439497 [Folsomia candida]